MNKVLNSRVIFIGADEVGKTTLLYQLKLNEIVKTLPTIGYNVFLMSVVIKNLNTYGKAIWKKIV